MSLPFEVNNRATPNANRQCLVCTFPYLQHFKRRFEEQNCKQIPKIILETAVKYEKRRKDLPLWVSPRLTGSGALLQWLAVKSPLGTCLDWKSQWGGWQGHTERPGDCGGAKALLAELREVDKIFVRPRPGSSTFTLVTFLPICPRIQ